MLHQIACRASAESAAVSTAGQPHERVFNGVMSLSSEPMSCLRLLHMHDIPHNLCALPYVWCPEKIRLLGRHRAVCLLAQSALCGWCFLRRWRSCCATWTVL